MLVVFDIANVVNLVMDRLLYGARTQRIELKFSLNTAIQQVFQFLYIYRASGVCSCSLDAHSPRPYWFPKKINPTSLAQRVIFYKRQGIIYITFHLRLVV